MTLRPDLIDLTALPEVLTPKSDAVLGEDPRCARADEATVLWERALSVWVRWVKNPDIRAIERFYVRRIKSVADYLEEYAALSWEQAIKAWWEKKD